MITKSAALATLSLAVLTIAGQAAAGTATRAWVSGKGVDAAGCGAPTAPCRSLQYAHDSIVGAGGEIDILDPAGYGAITITKAISIVNDGVGTAGVQSTSGNAITVNAGSGDVYLRGLNVDGVGGEGANGVRFSSGASLTLVDCVIQHFENNGIDLASLAGASKIEISNTTASDNGGSGLLFFPDGGSASITANINHSTFNNNGVIGLRFTGDGNSGSSYFVLKYVDASSNDQHGASFESSLANIVAVVEESNFELNELDGILAEGDASVHISTSYFNANSIYGINSASGIASSGDNHAEGNRSSDVVGPLGADALH